MAAAVRLGQHLKELRIHLCQKSPASKGVREFIENYYVELKRNNPKFPILIRECKGVNPKIYARYAFGQESSLPLDGQGPDPADHPDVSSQEGLTAHLEM